MNRNLILGIGILLLSILNISFKIVGIIDLSFIISLLGITSFVLQLLKKDIYRSLQIIWVLSQIPLITVSQETKEAIYQTNLLNLAQFFEFKLQFGLTYSTKTYSIGVNLVAFIYLAVIKFLRSKEFIGLNITMVPDSPNSRLYEHAPLKANIVEYSKQWFLAKLEIPITIDNSEFDLIRFKSKENNFFKPEKERQLCSVRLASSVHRHEISDSGFVK